MATAKPVEAEKVVWAEPFSALYARIKYQSYIILSVMLVVVVLAFALVNVTSHASTHVYEVRPDGSAGYIGDRQANAQPRAAEARFVAKRFVGLLYGWNSSTVVSDVTEAINMCSAPMGRQLREEIAGQEIVTKLRKRNIRSEIDWQSDDVTDQGDRYYRVKVAGRVNIFPLAVYEADPIDTRPFSMQVVLGVVPRDPDRRLNGLEVVRIERDASGKVGEEKTR